MRTEDNYEPVHTGAPRFGRPRAGVADFRGEPHHYECVRDAVRGDDSEVYLLRRIDAERFTLERELWHIFLRWCRALDAGRADLGDDAVLPEDRARHDRLKAALRAKQRAADPGGVGPPAGARAEFRQQPDQAGIPGRWQVRWLPLTRG